MKAAGYRLILMWASACEPAQLELGSVLYNPPGVVQSGCSQYDSGAIAAIRDHKPALVIIGERTTRVYSEPSNALFTNAQWTKALEATIREIKSKSTKVAVLQDIQFFNSAPAQCISSFPTAVQANCSIPNPNPAAPGHVDAEAAATKATGATLLKTNQWLCASSCSPIIGEFIPYVDRWHISASYAAYLTKVIGTELKAAPLKI